MVVLISSICVDLVKLESWGVLGVQTTRKVEKE